MFICLYKSDFFKGLIFYTKVYFITAVHFGMRFGKGLAYYNRCMRGILCEIAQMMNVYSCGKYCSLAR